MTIKITIQNDRILVRRWAYCKIKKRSLPTTLCSISKYGAPKVLPDEVITEHAVDAIEQAEYTKFIDSMNEATSRSSDKFVLTTLKARLEQAKNALEDPELKAALKENDYVELSEIIDEVKKLVTKNKNALKDKARKKTKAGEKKPTLTVDKVGN